MNLQPPGYELRSEVRFDPFQPFPTILPPESNTFQSPFLHCPHCLFPILGQVMGQRLYWKSCRQHIPLQAGVGQDDVDGVDQGEDGQGGQDDHAGAGGPHHHPRLREAGQVEDKGRSDEHRGDGGQSVINGELGAQSLCHLPAVHAQLLQQRKLPLIPLALAELLDSKDGCGSHGEGQGQVVQGEDAQGSLGGHLRLLLGPGGDGVAGNPGAGALVDVPKVIKLRPRYRLNCLGGIGPVVDLQPLHYLVRHHQDVAPPVDSAAALGQMLGVHAPGLEGDVPQSKGFPVIPQNFFQIGHAVEQVLPLFQLHRPIARNGPQSGVVAPAQDGFLYKIEVIVDGMSFNIVPYCVTAGEVDLILQGLLHRDIFMDVIQIECGVPAVPHAEIQVKTGVLRRPALEQPPEYQPAALGDDGGGKDHGDGGHEHPHGGQLGGEAAKHQQVLPLILPGGPLVEESWHPGGEAEEEAE